MFLHQNHGAGGGNGSIMVGMFVWLRLAGQNPFEQEFFVPARTDLGVKLLSVLPNKKLKCFEKNYLYVLPYAWQLISHLYILLCK
jgi:hypothetical protein